jgi:hypothetical protein
MRTTRSGVAQVATRSSKREGRVRVGAVVLGDADLIVAGERAAARAAA